MHRARVFTWVITRRNKFPRGEQEKLICVAQSKTPSTLQRSDSLRPTLSTFPFCAFFSGRKTRASVLFACAFTVKTHVLRLFEIFSRKNNSFRRYLETKILLSFFLLLFFISKNKTWRRFERSLCKINQFKKGREISLFSNIFENSQQISITVIISEKSLNFSSN